MLSIPAIQSFQENLESICTDLRSTLVASDHPAIDKRVEMSIHALEQLIYTQGFTLAQQRALLKIDAIAELVPLMREAFGAYENDVIRTHAHELLAQEKPAFSLQHPLIRRKYHHAVKEAHFANIKPLEKVTIVGHGHIPLSAIAYASRFRARVNAVEMDPDTMEWGRQAVHAFRLDKQIQVMGIEHLDRALASSDAVVLTHRLTDKAKWLEEILPHLNPGTRVLCRTAFGLRAMVHEHVPTKRLKGYTTIGTIQSSKSSMEGTVCLLA